MTKLKLADITKLAEFERTCNEFLNTYETNMTSMNDK